MTCLSFIMINVGYEFDIDKERWRTYIQDYLIGERHFFFSSKGSGALFPRQSLPDWVLPFLLPPSPPSPPPAMTAAGFPWIFVAVWFVFVVPSPLPWGDALLAARFAAPTSAGILFSMLEAAGMKDTWLFRKARVLAIFDDLDTVLLMIPLKVALVGFKWELSLELLAVFSLLLLSWSKLHAVRIPCSWNYTALYAVGVAGSAEALAYLSGHEGVPMEAVHLEVLLPAFAVGCVARNPHLEGGEVEDAEIRGGGTKFETRRAQNATAKPGALARRRGDEVGDGYAAVSVESVRVIHAAAAEWELEERVND